MEVHIYWPDSIGKLNINGDFLQGMTNRMAQAYHKYGPAIVDKKYAENQDHIESAKLRIAKYKATGNTEYLMDAANSLMIEFTYPQVEGAHFRATSTEESPGIVMKDGHIVHNKEQMGLFTE